MVNSQSFEHPGREQSEFNDFYKEDTYDLGFRKLPKMYERVWTQSIDKRFALILLISFVVHFMTAFYFAINPPQAQISNKDIRQIQERFASIVLDEEVISAPEIEAEEFVVNKKNEKREEITDSNQGVDSGIAAERSRKREDAGSQVTTTQGLRQNNNVGVSTRRKTRTQITKDVSSKGILGILSGTGSSASGDEVHDVLEDVDTGSGNLDDVLSQLDGIKIADSETERGTVEQSATGKRGREVKGSRATGGAGIDDLISDRGTAKSTSLKRKGTIVVSNIAAVENSDGIKSESRNSDDVSTIVNSHNSAIQYCYQRELKRNPDLKGKLVIRFTIGVDGKVKDVEVVSSTINNSRVEWCVINRVKRWDDFGAIDASKGDAVFRQVYTFGY